MGVGVSVELISAGADGLGCVGTSKLTVWGLNRWPGFAWLAAPICRFRCLTVDSHACHNRTDCCRPEPTTLGKWRARRRGAPRRSWHAAWAGSVLGLEDGRIG